MLLIMLKRLSGGTDDYQVDAERLKERSEEFVTNDEFDFFCKINTETNSRALDSKEKEELNAERVIDIRKSALVLA